MYALSTVMTRRAGRRGSRAADYRTWGNWSYVWNGGGDECDHSSVVAPSPQGLSAALLAGRQGPEQDVEEQQRREPEIHAPTLDTMFQPANASG